ncbi:MAG: FHA domain-containing protein [Planctomycetota bacterium]
MNQSSSPAMSGYRIRVIRQNASTAEHSLEDGRSIFLGSGNSCGIQIEGEGVAPIHCLIDVEDEAVSVQDWASEAGTIVNGKAVEDKVTITPGDIVRLGNITFELVGRRIEKPDEPTIEEPREESVGMETMGLEPDVSFAGDVASASIDEAPPSGPTQPVVEVPSNRLSEILGPPASAEFPPVVAQTPSASDEPASIVDTDNDGDRSEVRNSTQSEEAIEFSSEDPNAEELDLPTEAEGEAAIEELDRVFGESTNEPSEPEVETNTVDAALEGDSFTSSFSADDLDWDPESLDEELDQEIVQLLKQEIEDLRIQLAERDEHLATLQQLSQDEATETPVADVQADSTELVSRVDDLLAELEEHDERVATMQELLQSAEMQNHAEREERNCLETWVGEIEQRIGERESEWQAEVDALRERNNEVCRERDEVQQKFHAAAQRYGSVSDQEVVPDETLTKLQEQNASLTNELDESRKECLSLKNQLERAQTEEPEGLQEERAQLAQEKASVSRMRFELSKRLQDFGETPEAKDQPDREFAYKLQTLRAHLREIHEEEKLERDQRGESLFGRISGLWKRVEDKY